MAVTASRRKGSPTGCAMIRPHFRGRLWGLYQIAPPELCKKGGTPSGGGGLQWVTGVGMLRAVAVVEVVP